MNFVLIVCTQILCILCVYVYYTYARLWPIYAGRGGVEVTIGRKND